MPYTKYHTWNTRQTVLPGTFFLLIIFYSLRMEITLSHGHDDVCTFKRKRWNHRNCYCTRHKCWAKFVFPFHSNRLFWDDKISQVPVDFKLQIFIDYIKWVERMNPRYMIIRKYDQIQMCSMDKLCCALFVSNP